MPERAQADLAVIIPHFDDLVRLQRCLAALTAQNLDGTEIVVADNATPADLGPVRAAFPDVRFVIQPERGAAAARNMGVAETTAPWLVFLDSDCIPAADWLARARQLASGDPWVITGGRIVVFAETPPPRSGAEAFEAVFAFDQARYIREVGFSVTANLVASRAVFEAAGPMVVGLSEDVDWCRRAVGAGAKLTYDASLVVEHPARADWPALHKKWQRLTREGFGLTGGGAAQRVTWAAKALLMPFSAVAHMPRILRHGDLTGEEKGRAVWVLLRLRCARMIWMLRQAFSGAP